MAWDEPAGHVSHAFDEWKGVDSDIRAYLALAQRWIDDAYRATWDEAEREFARRFDPDRDDPEGHVDLFHDKVSGLWARDFFWMLRTGALRDAVSAFEVYLEEAATEVLDWYRFKHPEEGDQKLSLLTPSGHLSPSWGTLVAVHKALGTDIETEAVHYVRSLRHLLAHQRGRLRTEEQRERYLDEADADDWLVGDAYVGGDLPMSHERVTAMMDDLARVVRASDQAVWNHTYGGVRLTAELLQLTIGKRAPLVWVSA